MADNDAGEVAVLYRSTNWLEADLLARVLVDEGIPAACVNDGPGVGIGGSAFLGDGLQSAQWASWMIEVPADRLPEAERIADEWLSARPENGD